MWQLQSHHVALDHSRKDMWWWGYRDNRLRRDGRDPQASTRRGDRLTWVKPRSTTVPAHRTWDWGPAVFMSCRFCSRIFGKKIKSSLSGAVLSCHGHGGTAAVPYSSFLGHPWGWCSWEWTGWRRRPGERHRPLTTVKSTPSQMTQTYCLTGKAQQKSC